MDLKGVRNANGSTVATARAFRTRALGLLYGVLARAAKTVLMRRWPIRVPPLSRGSLATPQFVGTGFFAGIAAAAAARTFPVTVARSGSCDGPPDSCQDGWDTPPATGPNGMERETCQAARVDNCPTCGGPRIKRRRPVASVAAIRNNRSKARCRQRG